MIIDIIRDDKGSGPNFGQLFVDGVLIGQTLEDPDRRLEAGGKKVYGATAIPRGRYMVALSMSNRFKRVMPEVFDVPGFTGVRIHGGNTEADTHGCPLLGHVRTPTGNPTGIRDCKGPNERLIELIGAAHARGEEVWLEVT